MPRKTSYGPVIRSWLLEEIKADRGVELASRASKHFDITRQAVGRHLQRLLEGKAIAASGKTRSRTYTLAVRSQTKSYDLAGLQEHVVWTDDILPLLGEANIAPNVVSICEYGFTEMLNNAIDHSESPRVKVTVSLSAILVEMMVIDFGIGIFRKLRDARGLETDRQAILEVTKGKVTTDPSRHTGEGIFFTSRMMDTFGLISDALGLVHRRAQNDWLFETKSAPVPGTIVAMKIDPASDHTASEVFERYQASQDDYAFAKTQIVLALAETEGGNLVSRSQAKRVMLGLERFREVLLDFRGVPAIGPAFADEIFRVWARAHPDSQITCAHESDEVRRMIRRAGAAKAEQVSSESPSDRTGDASQGTKKKS